MDCASDGEEKMREWGVRKKEMQDGRRREFNAKGL
jgi:hypothetical protein